MRRRLLAVVLGLVCTVPSAAAAGSIATATWHRPIVAVNRNQSNNWSGYNQGTLEQGGKQFHSVQGDWIVPTASPHKAGEAEYSSTWVGIGGGCVDAGCTITDATLIQAGTEQDVNTSGKASYHAWWELIPAPSVRISNMAVHAGDHMRVSIKEKIPNLDIWTIVVKNLTTGRTFSLTTPYPSTHATAEWIEETPVVIGGGGQISVGPMPDLTTVKISRAKTNGRSAGLKSSESIQLVDFSGDVIATPSDPNAAANAFHDCTYATSCSPPAG
jgi:hypothetical protein